jgi:hypothetical protein
LILGYETKLFSVDPFFTLLQKLIRKLEEANLVVVIGYSFFDAYLNNLLIKFLNSGEKKKLFIVDPSFSTKENASESFADYIKLIQSDTSSLNIDNYKTLPSSKVSFFRSTTSGNSGAKEFYLEYFENQCDKLKTLYEELAIIEEPF